MGVFLGTYMPVFMFLCMILKINHFNLGPVIGGKREIIREMLLAFSCLGFIAQFVGWRAIFFTLGAIGILLVLSTSLLYNGFLDANPIALCCSL